MATSDSTTPMKRCSKCGEEYPATTEYFHRQEHGKFGLMGACKACKKTERQLPEKKQRAREYDKQWKAKNRNKINSQARERRQKNLPQRIQYERDWRSKNRQKSRDYTKKSRLKHIDKRRAEDRQRAREHSKERMAYNEEWRKANPEKQKAIQKREYWKHRDKKLAKSKEWRKTPRGRAFRKAATYKRRTLQKLNGGSFTGSDVQLHLRSQNGKCWWCGCELDPNDYHVDHRIALSKGGSNSANNICISCPTCNLEKRAKYPWEWKGRLL